MMNCNVIGNIAREIARSRLPFQAPYVAISWENHRDDSPDSTGSDAGGERAAIAYTILGCCRLAEVNPVEYLADVLPRLSRRIRLRDMYALMPARWSPSVPTAAVAPEPPAAQK